MVATNNCLVKETNDHLFFCVTCLAFLLVHAITNASKVESHSKICRWNCCSDAIVLVVSPTDLSCTRIQQKQQCYVWWNNSTCNPRKSRINLPEYITRMYYKGYSLPSNPVDARVNFNSTSSFDFLISCWSHRIILHDFSFKLKHRCS